MPEYQKTTLPNGLRILSIPKQESPSTTVMVLVGVGSRFETEDQSGIAHFIEHNVFKGTTTRTKPNQVSFDIESIGGDSNAGTGNEFTYYWAKSAAPLAPKILDVMLDISLNMTFPQKDLEIERGNVIEEINMYEDNPMRKVMVDYIDLVWNGHPLGRKISGTKETVSAFTRDDMVNFVHQNYTMDKTVVVISGGGDHKALVDQVVNAYQDVSSQKGPTAMLYQDVQDKGLVNVVHKELEQSHLCMGFRTFGRHDERSYVLDVANAILGEGMSSRLFFKVREELGLAYYIGSSIWDFDETGLWFVRAGVDNKRVDEALSAITAEFIKLARNKVTNDEINRAKEFIKGKTLLSVETSDDLGQWYGFQELLEKEVLSPAQYNQKIDQVTAEQVVEVVSTLAVPSKVSLSIIGPFEEKEAGRLRALVHQNLL